MKVQVCATIDEELVKRLDDALSSYELPVSRSSAIEAAIEVWLDGRPSTKKRRAKR